MTKLRFGTLGAATITPLALVQPVAQDPDVEVSVVAARDESRARAFAQQHGIARTAADYDAVIEDPNIDAVYVPLPVVHHCEWTLKALAAGKHVLCEKTFASNASEARRMADAAHAAGRVCMEAFHYRYHPVMLRLIEIVQSGLLGEIKHVEGVFDIGVPDDQSTYTDPALGGGSMMHMGCYPVSWLRHILGEEPVLTGATAVIGGTGVDTELSGEVRYSTGATGYFRGNMTSSGYVSHLKIEGSNGRVNATNPLVPHLGHNIELETDQGIDNEVLTSRPSYGFQLDAFKAAVLHGAPLLTDALDAVKQMTLIDAAFRAAGLSVYGLD